MSRKKKRQLPKWDRVGWEVIKMQAGRHAIYAFSQPILTVPSAWQYVEKAILDKVVEDHEEVQSLLNVMEQCYNCPDSRAALAVMHNALAYHGRIKQGLSGGKTTPHIHPIIKFNKKG